MDKGLWTHVTGSTGVDSNFKVENIGDMTVSELRRTEWLTRTSKPVYRSLFIEGLVDRPRGTWQDLAGYMGEETWNALLAEVAEAAHEVALEAHEQLCQMVDSDLEFLTRLAGNEDYSQEHLARKAVELFSLIGPAWFAEGQPRRPAAVELFEKLHGPLLRFGWEDPDWRSIAQETAWWAEARAEVQAALAAA